MYSFMFKILFLPFFGWPNRSQQPTHASNRCFCFSGQMESYEFFVPSLQNDDAKITEPLKLTRSEKVLWSGNTGTFKTGSQKSCQC